MKTSGDVYIAGSRTIDDWRAFRNMLVPGSASASWQKAYEDYFFTRLSLRYLEPIRVLQENDTFQGEGFSILAIQCSLIEFLESTVQGLSYRYRRRGDPPLGPHEYSDSGDLFGHFLTKRTPFDREFDPGLASSFYKNVRCGLLHEARTKGGWTIWAKSPEGKMISSVKKIVYRNDFQNALLQFTKWYEGALTTNASLQQAFIRKFDSLCT
jgi:hypothetical protein